MRYLLDTHILLWIADEPDRLAPRTRKLIQDPRNEILFSVVSLWEIGVKRNLGRPDFRFDPRLLRDRLLAENYAELLITADHALAVEHLPPLHRDPFDRMLLCQAMVEKLTIVTNDDLLSQYSAPIHRV